MPTIIVLVLYILVTWIGIVSIFNYSTYHRYFWRTLPVLIAFATLDGWAYERILGFGHYWMTFILLFFVVMFYVNKRQMRQADAFMQLTEDTEQLRQLSQSGARTITFFWLSVVLFAVSWFAGLLVAFNT